MKRAALFLFLWVYSSTILFAAQESKVELRKFEDRTEAVVSAPQKPKSSDQKGLAKGLSDTQDGIAWIAATTCAVVGKGTDITISGFQKTFGFVLSPLFKTLDVVNWDKGKKEKKNS